MADFFSDMITNGFWMYFFISILLAILISRNKLLQFVAGLGLILEAIYLTGLVPTTSFNMFGVVILGILGASWVMIGWKT